MEELTQSSEASFNSSMLAEMPSPARGEAEVLCVDINLIDPNPQQPRKVFADDSLAELTESIRNDGVLQPLLVTRNKNNPGRFVLLAGERRLRASKKASLTKVPILLKDASTSEALKLALIENIQRADLNIIEEAQAYKALIEDLKCTQEECAALVAKDRSSISNALRILRLPAVVQEDLSIGELSMGHGRALLMLIEMPESLLELARLIKDRGLSVRQTEALCKRFLRDGGDKDIKPLEENPDLLYVTERLRSLLRTKVKISGGTDRGRVEISYFSCDELERIVSTIAPQI